MSRIGAAHLSLNRMRPRFHQQITSTTAGNENAVDFENIAARKKRNAPV